MPTAVGRASGRRRTPRRATAALVGVLAVATTALGLTALTGDPGSGTGGEPSYLRYVALGDSFTSAPRVPVTDLASGCDRSRNNYPRLVARSLGITDLDDRSCSGAQVADLSAGQRTRLGVDLEPQLAALTPATELVTVGMGFNEGRLFGRIASRCRQQVELCRLAEERPRLDAIVDRVAPTLAPALVDVQRRAPRARVLLVGYPRMLPPTGDCAGLPRWRPEDRQVFRDLTTELDQQLRRAARDAGVEFVDFHTRSAGHDICAARPWVEGQSGRSAAALHPLAAGQRALAELVVERLRHPPSNSG